MDAPVRLTVRRFGYLLSHRDERDRGMGAYTRDMHQRTISLDASGSHPVEDPMSRDQRIDLPVTREEKNLIREAADRDSRSLNDWLRLVALREATKSKEPQ